MQTVTTEKITAVEEIVELDIEPMAPMTGSGGAQLGIMQMMSVLSGHTKMSGYRVTTDAHTYHVLIDAYDSCCENWGYLSSDDKLKDFVGAELSEVVLTDTALNQAKVDKDTGSEFGFDEGGIQFVDFKTDRGVLQLAVYNGHNGYYGHGIVVACDDKVLLNTTI